jgi:hypothetical protein
MKQLVYILLLLVLAQSCSQQNKSMKEEVMPAEVKEVASPPEPIGDTTALPNANLSKSKKALNKVDDKVIFKGEEKIQEQEEEFDIKSTEPELVKKKPIKESLEGEVAGVQAASSSRSKNSIEAYKTKKIVITPTIHSVFIESSQQKLQQLFDIAVLLDDKNTTQEMKAYALSNSSRYYLKPKDKMRDYFLELNKIKADSIVLSAMKLKLLSPLKELNTYKGVYKVQVAYYQNQKLLKQSKKVAILLLEIVPLNVDGQIYTTIESKVLEIK